MPDSHFLENTAVLRRVIDTEIVENARADRERIDEVIYRISQVDGKVTSIEHDFTVMRTYGLNLQDRQIEIVKTLTELSTKLNEHLVTEQQNYLVIHDMATQLSESLLTLRESTVKYGYLEKGFVWIAMAFVAVVSSGVGFIIYHVQQR